MENKMCPAYRRYFPAVSLFSTLQPLTCHLARADGTRRASGRRASRPSRSSRRATAMQVFDQWPGQAKAVGYHAVSQEIHRSGMAPLQGLISLHQGQVGGGVPRPIPTHIATLTSAPVGTSKSRIFPPLQKAVDEPWPAQHWLNFQDQKNYSVSSPQHSPHQAI